MSAMETLECNPIIHLERIPANTLFLADHYAGNVLLATLVSTTSILHPLSSSYEIVFLRSQKIVVIWRIEA